jgi:hypothetical protein
MLGNKIVNNYLSRVLIQLSIIIKNIKMKLERIRETIWITIIIILMIVMCCL